MFVFLCFYLLHGTRFTGAALTHRKHVLGSYTTCGIVNKIKAATDVDFLSGTLVIFTLNMLCCSRKQKHPLRSYHQHARCVIKPALFYTNLLLMLFHEGIWCLHGAESVACGCSQSWLVAILTPLKPTGWPGLSGKRRLQQSDFTWRRMDMDLSPRS